MSVLAFVVVGKAVNNHISHRLASSGKHESSRFWVGKDSRFQESQESLIQQIGRLQAAGKILATTKSIGDLVKLFVEIRSQLIFGVLATNPAPPSNIIERDAAIGTI